MSEFTPTTSGVSKARKLISTVLLLILLVVLAIEVRAAVGYAWSGSVMTAESKQGIFESRPHSEVKEMLKFWPAEEVVAEADNATEYRYSWFSLLAPVLSRDEPAYHVIFVKADDAEGAVYDVETPNSGDVSRLLLALTGKAGKISFDSESDEFEDDRAFGVGGTRTSPRLAAPAILAPPADPLLNALDADADGELSETELADAVASLLKADKDGDGVISEQEARPVRPEGAGGGRGDRASRTQRQRPPLEDE